MEEQQIQEFVHRVTTDETLRCALNSDPTGLIKLQGFSPRVTSIILRLVPHLAFERPLEANASDPWWHA